MFITQSNYARACGVCIETVGRRLRDVPWHRKSKNERLYHLARVIPTIRPREVAAGAVERLVSSARDPDDTLYVGGSDALPTAAALIDWLPDQMRQRAHEARNEFIFGVGNSSLCSPAVVENLGLLQTLVILQPDVLKFVLTGAPANVERIAPPFALVNNSANLKEAA